MEYRNKPSYSLVMNSQQTTKTSSNTDHDTENDDTYDPLAIPQVLTPAAVAQLASGFDASDVIELYLLQRQSYLHGTVTDRKKKKKKETEKNQTQSSPEPPRRKRQRKLDHSRQDQEQLNNNNGPPLPPSQSSSLPPGIPIQKVALGLRYRRRKVGTNNRNPPSFAQDSVELTLEYGPRRAGGHLLGESIPKIVSLATTQENNPDSNKKDSNIHDDDDDTINTQQKDADRFVSWENEARVYYTLRISPSSTTTQMAHVDPSDIGGDNVPPSTTKSSATASTAYTTAHYLATMTGAVLQDLLQTAVTYPTIGSRRRYQPFSVYRRSGDTSTTTINDNPHDRLVVHSSNDVDFLEHLWKHLAYVGVELEPVLLPQMWHVRLYADSIARVDVEQHSSSVATYSIPDFYAKLYQCVNAIVTADYSFYDANNKKEDQEEGDRDRYLQEPGKDDDDAFETSEDAFNGTSAPTGLQPTAAPSVLPQQPDAEKVAQDAAKAAQDAQNAAEQAQQSGNTEAAEAAKAAASAAQKAADSTASQAAAMAQKALLSGDGASMTHTLSSLCLSSPTYGIASPDSNVTTVYLYRDGLYYFEVNLTAPYLELVSRASPMPLPPQLGAESSGDFVDWSLAFGMLLFSLFGLVLLAQQILGRSLRIIRPLYKFQRFLFDPLNHHRFNEDDDNIHGRGHEYTFAEDVIPLSMGGRMAPMGDLDLSEHDDIPRTPSKHEDDFLGVNDNSAKSPHGAEVELVSAARLRRRSSSSIPPRRSPTSDDWFETDEMDFRRASGEEELPASLFRDPDHVQHPDLTSRSKIALPVSSPPSGRNSLHGSVSS